MTSVLLADFTSCNWQCQSQDHASKLASALSKSRQSISDQQLKIYCALTCRNFSRCWSSRYGRSLLHWAVVNDRTEFLEWLLDEFSCDIECRDDESGYTPLHCAMISGSIASAQLLINRGASLNAFDNEGLTPLDIARRDLNVGKFNVYEPTEVYSWGENMLFNLGHQVATSRSLPEPVDYFSRNGISISKVAMSKYHTAFLSLDGSVYTCGNGFNGRLGHGDTKDRSLPTKVNLNSEAGISVSVGDQHTTVLTKNHAILCWGSNHNGQLSLVNVPNVEFTSPHMVNGLAKSTKDSNFHGCVCGKTFTVFWTKDAIYGCGPDNGQFGPVTKQADISNVSVIRPINCLKIGGTEVINVACSDSAVVVVLGSRTSDRQSLLPESVGRHRRPVSVYLLKNHECRKIVSRHLDVSNVLILDEDEAAKRTDVKRQISTRLILTTHSGALYFWNETDQQLRRCMFKGLPKMIYPVAGCGTCPGGIMLLCKDGKLFQGKLEASPKATVSVAIPTKKHASVKEVGEDFAFRTTGDFVDPTTWQIISVKPVYAVHRGMAVASSSDGKNFCVIQQSPKIDLVNLPTINDSQMASDYARLLTEACLEDCLHDVELQTNVPGVRNRAVHKFILASRSAYFAERLDLSTTTLKLDNLAFVAKEGMLDRLLEYIYTDDCDLLRYDVIINNNNSVSSEDDPVKETQKAAKMLGLKDLSDRLKGLRWDKSTYTIVRMPNTRTLAKYGSRFSPDSFSEFCDVNLLCADGVTLSAHRCILAARSEYFQCMFGTGWWTETGRCQTLSANAGSNEMKIVLHFLYTDELPDMNDSASDHGFLENYSKLLVCADQWLLNNLRSLCEIELSTQITLKNAAELMEFARTFNADQLLATCAEFITLNICAILENQNLRNLSIDCLQEISGSYRRVCSKVSGRLLTPFSDEPSVEDISNTYTEALSNGVIADDILTEFIDQWNQHNIKDPQLPKKRRTPRTRKSSDGAKSSAAKISPPPQNSDGQQQSAQESPEHRRQRMSTSICEEGSPEVPSASIAEKTKFVSEKKRPPIAPRPRGNAWNLSTSSADDSLEMSLRDLMVLEEEQQQLKRSEPKKSAAATTKRSAICPWANLSSSPPTAWGSPPTSSISSASVQIPSSSPSAKEFISSSPQTVVDRRSFGEILKEEETKQASRGRLFNKSLKFVQIEELAMRELMLIYQVDDQWDETITVERAPVDVAEPMWKAHTERR